MESMYFMDVIQLNIIDKAFHNWALIQYLWTLRQHAKKTAITTAILFFRYSPLDESSGEYSA